MADVTTDVVERLRATMRGVVSAPGDAAYDEACSIWNGAIDRRPALVASCSSSADVAAALAFAQELDLEVSVRGGGHNYAGFALCDAGLMIDLTPLKGVSVDPAARRAVCGGGTTWAELDAATQEHGLAVPGGFISHTGVAGLTLGGGLGWLSRLAGLSCDNLVGAEVVTPDGEIRRASASDDADLLWAIQGGGGNFGVVTSFEFALHLVGPMVHLGLFMFSPEDGADLFRFARDYVGDLPDECGVFMAGMNAPPEPFVPEEHHFAPVYAMAVLGLADEDAHARLVAPIRDALHPVVELVTPIPYVMVQQMFNASAPWGSLAYEKSVYLPELTDAAIEVIVTHQPRKSAPLSFLPIFVLGGAFARVDDDATAFGGRRDVRYVVNISATADTQELYEADRAWVRAFWADLVAHAPDAGSYVNFMTEIEGDRVRSAYGTEKFARLAQLKARYDPTNVLHLNANIAPAT
ncbi:MAG: linked oxidase-like protein [Acidimicrobiales bacterium]|nr:linked oxidase-like protein [Acidimicrobiales bacterium]